MARLALGEIPASLFAAGAALGKFLNEIRAQNAIVFNRKCSWQTRKKNLGCEAGCGLTVSFSEILGSCMLGSFSDRPGNCKMTAHLFSCIFFDNFAVISWQAQYLVRLEGDTCCSAHRKRLFDEDHACEFFFAWQAQYI